jgi:hypothetical protein
MHPDSYVCDLVKLRLYLVRQDKFDELMVAAAEEWEAAKARSKAKCREDPCCSLSYCSAARFILF